MSRVITRDNVELARDDPYVLKANFHTNRRGLPVTQYYLHSTNEKIWIGTNGKASNMVARLHAEATAHRAALVRAVAPLCPPTPAPYVPVVAEVPRSTITTGAAQLTGSDQRIQQLPGSWQAQALSLLRRPLSRSPVTVPDNTPPRSRSQSRND